MPFSFNGINPTNNSVIGNTMIISGVSYTFTLTITPGNYNIVQFCDELTAQLNNTYASFSSGTASFRCYVSSLITAKIIISCVLGSESSLSLTINFGYNANSVGNAYMGDIIGFKNSTTITPTSSATNTAYFNVNPISQIVLRSQALTGFNFEFLGGATASGFGSCATSTIIACFSVNTAPQSYLNSANIIPMKTKLKNTQINNIDLTFYPDDSYVPLNFQGAVSNLTLVITEYEPILNQNFYLDALGMILEIRESLSKTNESILSIVKLMEAKNKNVETEHNNTNTTPESNPESNQNSEEKETNEIKAEKAMKKVNCLMTDEFAEEIKILKNASLNSFSNINSFDSNSYLQSWL